MKFFSGLYKLVRAAVVAIAVIIFLIACFGSPKPPECPRTSWLVKLTTGSVIIPGSGAAFSIPIGILPFVTWDTVSGNCGVPVSAGVTLTSSCVPSAGGATIPVGPQFTPLITPISPGAQPVAGGTVPFALPAGMPPSICSVVGTYDVTFAGGTNTPSLSTTGDSVVCLVEPSPADPNLPRLDMSFVELIDTGTPGDIQVHQGDQTYKYYRVENNDLDKEVVLNVSGVSRQVAGFPDGFTTDAAAFNEGFFRISQDGADNFPLEFFGPGDPLPFAPLPGDPGSPIPPESSELLIIGPGEVQIVALATRTFGACADGSCSEDQLIADALFRGEGMADEPRHACVQTSVRVNNQIPPQYPGWSVRDAIKVHAQVDSQWGPMQFINPSEKLIDETHANNLLLNERVYPHTGLQLTGSTLTELFNLPYPDQQSSLVTLPVAPNLIRWDGIFFDQRNGFAMVQNHVTVYNANQLVGECAVPSIRLNDALPNELDIEIFPAGQCDSNTPVIIRDGPAEIYSGSWGDLMLNPGFMVDEQTCRTVSSPHGNNLDARLLILEPPYLAMNFHDGNPVDGMFQAFDQFGDPAAFSATLEGPNGLTLPLLTGTGELPYMFDPSQMPEGLNTQEWFVVVENPAYINSPVRVPVLARSFPASTPIEIVALNLVSAPVIQVGDPLGWNVMVPPVVPDPGDPFRNMELLVGVETPDVLEFSIVLPPTIDLIGIDTPLAEIERLKKKFDPDLLDRCVEGVRRCGLAHLGDGMEFDTEIFADGFESGDVSAWSYSAGADNSTTTTTEGMVAVLDADGRLPVSSEDNLRDGIVLLNGDTSFPGATIGLLINEIGILSPLPSVLVGTVFDGSGPPGKSGSAPSVVIDGSNCPAPCSGLVLENGGGVNGIAFEGFPDYGLEVNTDGVAVTNSEFTNNIKGGILVAGSDNQFGAVDDGNSFLGGAGAGIIVESGQRNSILFNTFTGHTGLAIDLGNDGVTPNGAPDTGPNKGQNYPVIDNALTGEFLMADGILDGSPNTQFAIQFFASPQCHATGFGEGAILFAAENVTTDGGGLGAFGLQWTPPPDVGAGMFMTATATDPDGNTSEMSACTEIVGGVATENNDEVPSEFVLSPNYPNPFNPSTTIRYAVPERSAVLLVVYDIQGREVAVLVDRVEATGWHNVVFDASNLSSGTYLYRLKFGTKVLTRSLVLMK